MEWTKLAVELLSSWAWPVAALMISWIFREPLRELIPRISKGKLPGGLEFEVAAAAQLEVAVDAAAALQTAVKDGDSEGQQVAQDTLAEVEAELNVLAEARVDRSRAGKIWNYRERRRLREMHREGRSIEEIAEALRRTPGAVKIQLAKEQALDRAGPDMAGRGRS